MHLNTRRRMPNCFRGLISSLYPEESDPLSDVPPPPFTHPLDPFYIITEREFKNAWRDTIRSQLIYKCFLCNKPYTVQREISKVTDNIIKCARRRRHASTTFRKNFLKSYCFTRYVGCTNVFYSGWITITYYDRNTRYVYKRRINMPLCETLYKYKDVLVSCTLFARRVVTLYYSGPPSFPNCSKS